MKWLKDHGRKPTALDAKIIMSHAVTIPELARLFGKEIPNYLIDELNYDLQLDLNFFFEYFRL